MLQAQEVPTVMDNARQGMAATGLNGPSEAQIPEDGVEEGDATVEAHVATHVDPSQTDRRTNDGSLLGLGDVDSMIADMQPIAEFIHRIAEPVAPAILPLPTRAPRAPRSSKNAATATRRSRRIQNRKTAPGYTGGNHTLRLARRLIMSKRGLAIAEPGESEDDTAAVSKLRGAFRHHPLRPKQTEALIALARQAGGKGRRKVRIQ